MGSEKPRFCHGSSAIARIVNTPSGNFAPVKPHGGSVSQVSSSTTPSTSSVTRVSKQLEEKGLVQRKRAEASEREVLASLTPEGETFFAKHFLKVVERVASVFDEELSGREQRQLTELLGRLA